MPDEKKPEVVKVATTFKNKLMQFPPHHLTEIGIIVGKNKGADEVIKYLKANYKGPIPIPNRKTVAIYVKWIKPQVKIEKDVVARLKQEVQLTESELRKFLDQLNISRLDVKNRMFVIENIASYLLNRVQTIAQLQDVIMDPRFENILTNQLAEVHSMMMTLLKYDDDIKGYEFIAKRIVEKFFEELAPAIRRAAEETWGGDKIKLFLDKVQKYNKAIDFNRIRSEAIDEAASFSKDGNSVNKNGAKAA